MKLPEIPINSPTPDDSGSDGEAKGSTSSEKATNKGEASKKGMGASAAGAASSLAKNPKAAAKKMAVDKAKDVAGNAPGVGSAVEAGSKAADLAMKVKSAALAVKGAVLGIKGAVVALANPVSLIIIACVLVLGFFSLSSWAVFQTFGENENMSNCTADGSGGSNVTVGTSEDVEGRKQDIAKWMATEQFEFLGSKPMNKNQIAGFIGNMHHESGGTFDPKKTQDGSGISKDATNAEIMAIPQTTMNKAVGIVQWDGSRRYALAKYAEDNGLQWNTMDTQLGYLKTELEGAHGSTLVGAGFNKSGISVEEATRLIVSKFEIPARDSSGEWLGWAERLQVAEAFASDFTGGYSSGTGDSCTTGSGSANYNQDDLVQMAIDLSYPTSAESKVGPGDSYGESKAKPEYKAAKAEAMKISPDPMANLYASCDRFVATVIITLVDEDLPWGSTTEQGNYLKDSPKWQQYTTKSEAQPGDIWVTRTGGHVILYLGDVDGRDTIAHASYLDRVAALGDASYLSESLVDTGGRAYYGYRFVG